MRFLTAILLGYLTLVITSLLLLVAMRQWFGTETLLVNGRWALAGWFAAAGPLLIVMPGLLAGLVAGWVAGRLRPGVLLAGFVLVLCLTATFTEVRRENETDERKWTPKFTEMIRRVREPTLAMVAGSFTLSGGVFAGTILAQRPGRRRESRADLPILHRDPIRAPR